MKHFVLYSYASFVLVFYPHVLMSSISIHHFKLLSYKIIFRLLLKENLKERGTLFNTFKIFTFVLGLKDSNTKLLLFHGNHKLETRCTI